MSKQVWSESNAIEVETLSGIAARVLEARGYDANGANDFLFPNYEKIIGDPFELVGMKKAVARINQAIKKSEKIVVYGDYDIDGLSASTLLFDALSKMGNTPELYIPDRFEEGYGLNSAAIEKLKKNGAQLVISVDCGVTAHEQAGLAKKIGLDLIITDHHEPNGGAPKGAIATINPKLQKDSAFKDLAGVGVAFYLALAIQTKTGLLKKGQEKWLLDMVALGTVCDVVPMTGLNRGLTKFGLLVLQKSKRPGILALMQAASVDQATITESDLGFKIGPRLNAAGRLAHAKKALDLLTATDSDKAQDIAYELNELNHARQQATKQIFEEADHQAKQFGNDPVLVLHSPDWSHGVVGIVASRIAEKWHKPVILMQELKDYAKGSARSFGTFNIVEAISSCAQILDSYGGHAFAAGLKIKTELIKELRYRLNEYALANMAAENNLKVLEINLNVPAELSSLELYDGLNQLSPYGNSNPRPICVSQFKLVEVRTVGSDGAHLKLVLSDSHGSRHDAIGFGMGQKFAKLQPEGSVRIAYAIGENLWNNTRKHQIEVIDIKPIE